MSDDITVRARDLLAGPKPYFHRDKQAYSCLSELLAEVERLRAEHDPAHCYHCTRCADADDSQREGYKRSQAEIERLRGALESVAAEWESTASYHRDDVATAFKDCALDVRDVLRGDQ